MSRSSSNVQTITLNVELPEAFDFLFQPARYKAAYGGRGSAKSHSFAEALIVTAAQRPYRTLCCRETQTSIRDSVKRLLDDKIKSTGFQSFYTSTDSEIRGANGSLFIFAGLRNSIEAIKSMEGIDRVWIEEAQTVSKSSLDVLIPTIRKPGSELWFSWNPKLKTDPVDAMFRCDNPPPNSIIRSINWEDNPWFPDVLRAEMEYDRRRDPDKYAWIWLGGYQKNSATRVFNNWRIGSHAEFKEPERPYFGGDWGFADDPTVLERSYLEGRTLFLDAEAWALHCDIDYTPFLFGGGDDLELQRLNKQAWESDGMMRWKHHAGISGARKWPIIADSARPETISYMQQHGFPRMIAAKKGPGSVEDGIEFLKSLDIVVHPDCFHAADELTLYSWKTDKLTGEILPVLEDKKNNVIDALRYSVEGIRKAGIPLSQGSIVGTPRHREVQVMVNPGRKQF